MEQFAVGDVDEPNKTWDYVQIPEPISDAVLERQADVLVERPLDLGPGDPRPADLQFALVGVDVAEPKVEKVIVYIVQRAATALWIGGHRGPFLEHF